MVRVDEFVAFGSRPWLVLAGLILAGRSCDLFSTWIATPNLVLEGNPVARRLGWKFGIPLNVTLGLLVGCWPLPAIALTTTSLLVAARNLQSAWLMRTLGETNYRCWMSDRLHESPRGLAGACFFSEAALFAAVGGALLWFARWELVPFGIGLGMAAYALAVALFTGISLWRLRH